MLRRLFLIMLILGFALPAWLACGGTMQQARASEPVVMASCHESAEHAAPMRGHEQPRHDECIGCIAPLAIAMFRPVSEPDFYMANFDPLLVGPEHTARPSAPEPPPPKDCI